MTPEEAEITLRLAETQVNDRVAYYCGLDVKTGRMPVCATSDDPLNELTESFQLVTDDRIIITQWLLETPTSRRLEGLLLAYDDVTEKQDASSAFALADTIIELTRQWVSCEVRINERDSEAPQSADDLNHTQQPSSAAEAE